MFIPNAKRRRVDRTPLTNPFNHYTFQTNSSTDPVTTESGGDSDNSDTSEWYTTDSDDSHSDWSEDMEEHHVDVPMDDIENHEHIPEADDSNMGSDILQKLYTLLRNFEAMTEENNHHRPWRNAWHVILDFMMLLHRGSLRIMDLWIHALHWLVDNASEFTHDVLPKNVRQLYRWRKHDFPDLSTLVGLCSRGETGL